MSGARALWIANGMKREMMGKPIIAIANSFTQFVPGHTHLHEIGQIVKREIEALGCYAAEFNTIAIDDGIAMGHDGMLYSLPSRDIIADSVEYMANAHKVDALVCISNCDKITPGMLMASMRLNIPTVFVSGGPMEAGNFRGRGADLIDAMVLSADEKCTDEEADEIEACACPGCGSCSGMFTANSMNCLNEAIGLALPGNGTIVATHKNRIELFKQAAHRIVENAYKYYNEGDESVLPKSIATRDAFLNAMTLDIAMGGSTNTVLHLLAVAHEAGVDFTMDDIDALSRRVPCICKVAPTTQKFHIEDVNRAGGILGIMGELAKGGLLNTDLKGKVVLLDFNVYAHPQSAARILILRELYNRYAARGLEIYQVSLDGDEHFWKTAVENVPWVCVRPLDAPQSKEATLYGVQELPTYFLINRAGELVKRDTMVEDLEKELEQLLAE